MSSNFKKNKWKIQNENIKDMMNKKIYIKISIATIDLLKKNFEFSKIYDRITGSLDSDIIVISRPYTYSLSPSNHNPLEDDLFDSINNF